MNALILTAAALLSTPAFAMFEVKGHYDVLNATPSGFNTQMQDYVTGAPKISGLTGYGADVAFKFPVVPLVVGLRHETFGVKKTADGNISGAPVSTTSTLTGSRTSVLVGYRVISTPVGYAGLLAHVTPSQQLKYEMKSTNAVGATNEDNFTGVLSTGYGAGVEAGLTYGHAIIGAEAGYTMLKATKFNSNGGEALDDHAKSLVMDLSGTYVKVSVGGRF